MDRSTYQQTYRQNYKAQARRVNLTFGLSEYHSIARAAKSSGEPVSAYVKRIAVAAHHDTVAASLPEDVLEGLADLTRVIRTIANNVNQMARHSNTIGTVLDEQEVFAHIQRLEAELKQAVTKASSAAGQGASDQGTD